jgi:hypothetical protein
LHVSYSALNLQKTEKFFEAKASRLSNIMERLGHKKLNLLKIDIEGTEYKVIDSIIQDKIDIGILCVEFDEFNNKLDDKYLSRIKSAINRLINFGYVVIKIERSNYTFLKNSL